MLIRTLSDLALERFTLDKNTLDKMTLDQTAMGKLYLYNAGYEATAVTGGWNGLMQFVAGSGTNYAMSQLTLDANKMSGSFSSGMVLRACYRSPANAINLSAYKSLIVRWKGTGLDSDNLFMELYVAKSRAVKASDFSAYVQANTNNAEINSVIDISSLLGDYYLSVNLRQAYNSIALAGTIEVYEIRLEP